MCAQVWCQLEEWQLLLAPEGHVSRLENSTGLSRLSTREGRLMTRPSRLLLSSACGHRESLYRSTTRLVLTARCLDIVTDLRPNLTTHRYRTTHLARV